ncbi:MAG: hypothetical protein H6834_00985 [Planctomycetes bacterium]|nr:hypothetical protein [Planctomycetota bacterium]
MTLLFRIVLLLAVSFAGCIVFYARRDLEPAALVRKAGIRALVVSLYVAIAYGGMALVTHFFIDA